MGLSYDDCMRDLNEKRVIFYGRDDYAAGVFRDRCQFLLVNAESVEFASINDAIEAHQTQLTVDAIPELFQWQLHDDYQSRSRILFHKACKFIFSELDSKDVGEVYAQVESYYCKQFWQLVESCRAWQKVKASDFERLLMDCPECLDAVLQYKMSIEYFGEEIKRALTNNPKHSAELIIRCLAAEAKSQKSFYLPENWDNSQIDHIMLSYIHLDAANPNYLQILQNWPSSKVSQYNPSPEVRVKAKRQYERFVDGLFQNGTGLRCSVSVIIDMNQRACKGAIREGLNLTYSFGGSWLKEYMDPATVMNNFIYLFDFVDSQGLILASARQHEANSILATLGMHVKGEYDRSTGFEMRSNLASIEAMAYANFLEGNGKRLESAIEWVYNQYFAEEFDINGFSLALPSQRATWLDKCKAVGPEIERAVKAYSLYSKYSAIDNEYFPYECLKSFSSLKALDDKKYVIAGLEFERFGNILFSNESLLSYLYSEDIGELSFYEMMKRHSVIRSNYPEYLQPMLSMLIDNGFVVEGDEDGRLMPTDNTAFLRIIWEHGAVSLMRFREKDLDIIESLTKRRIVTYCDKLFAPFEADYLDYMFNNASFTNSVGLRNKYDHANSAVKDPQANNIKQDYFTLLSLLICITLKINEELMRKTGKGGLDSFIDWPYYDRSVLRLTKKIGMDKRGDSTENCE